MGCGVVTKTAEALGVQAGKDVLVDVSTDLVGAGVSVKYTPLKKGLTVIQHKHAYPHLSILVSGIVIVRNDDETFRLDATKGPKHCVISAGKYHSVEALTDAVWLCVHHEDDGVN